MNMLIAIDGSKHDTGSLRMAAHYGREGGTKFSLLHIISSVADIDLELSASDRDRLLESMKQRGGEILEHAEEQLRQYGATHIMTVLATAPSPATEIISFAEKERVDLIVIGSRGRNANGRFLLGSVADSVVRYGPCNVFVVKESSRS